MSVSKFLRPDLNKEVTYWINHNLVNHLKTNPENYTEIEHIIDFLNSDKAPKRLQKMSYSEAQKGAEKWNNTLIKKGKHIVETDEDVEVVLNFEDGFRLVRLKGDAAFKREGHLMRHCVGSYSGKDDCKIYSLRDAKNEPHCTMEVDEEVRQIKGKGNGSIHPNYITYVIQALEYFGLDVREHEMQNLGYLSLHEETWKIFDKEFKKLSEITFNGKRFLYVHGKVE
jgi:hypothetical protein